MSSQVEQIENLRGTVSSQVEKIENLRGTVIVPVEARSFGNAIWSFIESRNWLVVGRSAAPERPGRPGSGPTVQHGHWGSQIRFNDEAIRLSEARQAATRAARASKWLDVLRLMR